MTLIVGILCRDGAVIAADQQSTHGSGVGQPTTKIRILDSGILFAASGDVGMGQQIERIAPGYFEGGNAHTEISKLRDAIWERFVHPAILRARSIDSKRTVSTSDAMFAAGFDKGVEISVILQGMNLEFLTKDSPYFSLGSGKPNTDPLLRFIWSILFPDNRNQLPSLEEGILAAYWAVETAINDFQSPSVGFGFDIFVLKREKEAGKIKYVASQIDEHKIRECNEFINALEEKMRAFIKNQGPGDISPPPKVPDPSKK